MEAVGNSGFHFTEGEKWGACLEVLQGHPYWGGPVSTTSLVEEATEILERRGKWSCEYKYQNLVGVLMRMVRFGVIVRAGGYLLPRKQKILLERRVDVSERVRR